MYSRFPETQHETQNPTVGENADGALYGDFPMTMLKSRLPVIFLIYGAILRIATLGSAAIWFDEAVLLYRTTIPLMQLFSNHSEDSGDLLLELLLRPIMGIDPRSLWLLRLPALLAGLISLWLVWKLMQWLQFTWWQQCLSAALVAFLPGLLWMGQDGRPYGLLACLFLAAIWFALESRWLGLVASCGLMVYCHSTGAVFAVGALAIALYLYPWKARRILISGALIAMTWLPALLRIVQNDNWADYAWGATPTFEIWAISGYVAFWTNTGTYQFFFAFTVMALTMPLLFSFFKARSRIVPLAAWSVPLIGMMLFSLHRNVIIYRTLIPLLFPFALWLGWELGSAQKPKLLRNVLSGFWAVALVVGLIAWHPADRGSHLDQITAEIRAQWQPGDQLVYASSTVGLPFEYYLGDLPQKWLDIAKDPLMLVSGIPRDVRNCQGPCKRAWVIIPDETFLITPAEWTSLDKITQGKTPVYSIKYIQAATINVYLEDVK